MKLPILSTATIVLISLTTTSSAIAQSIRITCQRDQNVITCPGYGSFNYRSNNNNDNNGNYNNNRPDIDRAINQIYQQYLGRNVDAAGLQAYRNAIMNGRSIEDIRNEIANSSEARDRNNNNANSNGQNIDRAINQIYQQYLGRNADASGLEFYHNAVVNGRSIEDVRNEIASSSEARDRR